VTYCERPDQQQERRDGARQQRAERREREREEEQDRQVDGHEAATRK
jgi:hypothetical protein